MGAPFSGAERHGEHDPAEDPSQPRTPYPDWSSRGRREAAGLTRRLGRPAQRRFICGRFEAGERRIDVIEFIEIARVLEVDPRLLFAKLLD